MRSSADEPAQVTLALPFGEEAASFREDVLEELRQRTWSETIGADLKLVAISARIYIYGRIESDVTYTAIVHEYVKSLLSCEEGFHAWLYCRRNREVSMNSRRPRLSAKACLMRRTSGGSFGLGLAGRQHRRWVMTMCVWNLAESESYISVSTSHDEDLD